jgi:putative salt-induced outer membrane protein
MLFKNSIVVMVLLGTTGQLFAIEPAPPWKGDAELGIVSTSGNTKNTSIKARANVVHEQDQWRHTAKFDALNTSNATTTTSERYALSGKSDYKFDERSFLFGLVGYENDRFAGFNSRINEVLGYGYRAINQDNLILDIEVGPGARQTQLRNITSSRWQAIMEIQSIRFFE